jgi:5-methylcytosine-specific restriction enzyme subunit McrC
LATDVATGLATGLGTRVATEPPAGPRVPIENLFYLLCYATNRLDVRERVPVEALVGASPTELLATLLAAMTHRLRLRGLPRAYRTHGVDTRAPRGRLAVGETVGRALLLQGRVHCEVSELTPDVPLNRALKAGLRVLTADPRVRDLTRARLRRHLVALGEVTLAPLTEGLLAQASAGRLEPLHRSVLGLLELVLLGLPRHADDGRASAPDYFGSPQKMGHLFEDFVRQFLRREQEALAVSQRHIPWAAATDRQGALGGLTEIDRALLPQMRSDVTLVGGGRRVLIECKYSQRTLQSNQGGAPKLRSAHLYQLGTYLQHLRETPGPPPLGVLLYAQVERPLDVRLRLGGQRLWIQSIDLNQPWEGVHRDMLGLAESWATA